MNGKMQGPGTETVWIQPKQVIVREGEIGTEIYVLLSGELEVSCREKPIGRIVDYGEVFGELGALTGQARTATVTAVVATELLVIRNAKARELSRIPSVLRKIDEAIVRRFQIISNKTRMYTSMTAQARRMLLQQVMWESTERGRKNDLKSIKESVIRQTEMTRLRHQIRQRIDEAMERADDTDDPRLLDRLAFEYGAQDSYRDRLAAHAWLDERPVCRLHEIAGEWALISDQHDAETVIRKAELTIATSEILNTYEEMPGIKHEMDLARIENLVPFNSKLEALRSCYQQAHRDELEDNRRRLYFDRQITLAVETARADAGRDVVMLINAARQLGVEKEYGAHIRNLVAITETPMDYVEPNMPDPQQATQKATR